MKKNKISLLILLMLSVPLLLISCETSAKTPPLVASNDDKEQPNFKLNIEDISNVTIFNYESQKHISAEVNKEEDIKALVTILNSNTTEVKPHTLENYRDININMKNGNVLTLMFAGLGQAFSVDNTNTYMLDPSENYKVLNQLIERVEKEYSTK
ncbi:hypothetical protein J2T13_005339 [Paenibacillus sp. DS2015]|uniref:hypothetical protein n=1 Tax=Paenibacillus sp. DS2015 TaxID=3373917 RepID=UPI003D1CA667